MSVPTCPIHNSPLKQGRNGGFFCPKKLPDGSWCPSKQSGSVAAAPAAVAPTPQPGATTPAHLLLIAALDFASRIYQGTGQGDDAVTLANQVYAGWRGEL